MLFRRVAMKKLRCVQTTKVGNLFIQQRHVGVYRKRDRSI